MSSTPYNKPVQFRKYLETIKFHEEVVVTRKTSQPHLFSTLTILYTVRNHFLSVCSILFLYFPSASQLSYNPMVFFKSRCLPLIPGIPLFRESQGIPGDQTIPVDTSGQKQYLPYHRITITLVIKMRLPVSKVTLAVQFLPSLNSSGSSAFEIM